MNAQATALHENVAVFRTEAEPAAPNGPPPTKSAPRRTPTARPALAVAAAGDFVKF
jgi:hypothetical protein